MKKNILHMTLFVTFTLATFSCAHHHRIDSPAPEEAKDSVKVGIGSAEVCEGDKVNVMQSVCKKVFKGRAGYINECYYKKSGEAVVTKVLGKDSALIRPDEGITLGSTTHVEAKDDYTHTHN